MTGDQVGSRDTPRGEITRHLLAWSAGDDRAADTAFSALYATLRRLAVRALSAGSLGELVAIHGALEALAAIDPTRSQIVELRFFGGMTHDEIASYLGVSLATVERRWRLARAWLHRELKGAAP